MHFPGTVLPRSDCQRWDVESERTLLVTRENCQPGICPVEDNQCPLHSAIDLFFPVFYPIVTTATTLRDGSHLNGTVPAFANVILGSCIQIQSHHVLLVCMSLAEWLTRNGNGTKCQTAHSPQN